MAITAAGDPTDLQAGPRSVLWRAFLSSLAAELEARAGPDGSAAILRGVGQQMAKMLTLMPADSIEALEMEMNLVLGEVGWGHVRLRLQEAERCVVMVHTGLPPASSAGKPPGTWLAPVLEGLYEGWMGQQPGADGTLRATIDRHEHNTIFIRYGR
jgi:hypothetical protein